MDGRRRLGILGYGSAEGAPWASLIPPADFEKSWQLLMPDGGRLQGGAAAVEVLTHLRGWRVLGYALMGLRLVWLADLAYRFVSKQRGLLGRLVRDAPGPTRLP